MKKSFPCWVCKAKGSWVEPVTDEGQGPTESCGYCDGHGMIEINGDTHKRIRAEKIALQIVKYSSKREWDYEELLEIGHKALKLVQN